jgi:hypothetical protein
MDTPSYGQGVAESLDRHERTSAPQPSRGWLVRRLSLSNTGKSCDGCLTDQGTPAPASAPIKTGEHARSRSGERQYETCIKLSSRSHSTIIAAHQPHRPALSRRRPHGAQATGSEARRGVTGADPGRIQAEPRWSVDFVHDQLACGRRLRILNIVDDVTRECLAAIPDTSISGRRVARELTALI